MFFFLGTACLLDFSGGGGGWLRYPTALRCVEVSQVC